MRRCRRLHRLALGALFLVPFVGVAANAKGVVAEQSKPLVESGSFAMHGWTWSGWDAALLHPRTPAAQYNRGVMHATGHGQPQNDDEALKWFRLAAEGGHVLAQCNLGVLYASGRGVPQDDVRAWAWFAISASQGDKTGRRNGEIIASSMTSQELSRARQLFRALGTRHRPVRSSSTSRSAK